MYLCTGHSNNIEISKLTTRHLKQISTKKLTEHGKNMNRYLSMLTQRYTTDLRNFKQQ